MITAIIMNTTLYNKSVPFLDNTSVEVKANSSIVVKTSSINGEFLRKLKLEGIRVSLSQSALTEVPVEESKEVTPEASEVVETPAEEIKEEVKEELEIDLDSLDLDKAREVCRKLGIKVRNNFSLENLKSKLANADKEALIEAMK